MASFHFLYFPSLLHSFGYIILSHFEAVILSEQMAAKALIEEDRRSEAAVNLSNPGLKIILPAAL